MSIQFFRPFIFVLGPLLLDYVVAPDFIWQCLANNAASNEVFCWFVVCTSSEDLDEIILKVILKSERVLKRIFTSKIFKN